MPKIGDEITREGYTFSYTGYGNWSRVTDSTTITGDIPLADGAATSANQDLSDRKQENIQGSVNDLVKQLKINNLHLSLLTDNIIRETEVE